MANAKMTVAELEAFLHREFPQAFSAGHIMIESADGTSSLLRQPYSEQMLRPGGTISGPTLMALADFAMVANDLSTGRLVRPFDVAVTADVGYWFIFPEGRRMPKKVKLFRDWLRAEVPDSADGYVAHVKRAGVLRG